MTLNKDLENAGDEIEYVRITKAFIEELKTKVTAHKDEFDITYLYDWLWTELFE